ncbi:uncharacterized protein BYT42DRAFT_614619 [Radiomyces spectabilis]|uniref:uncharacterized protein n=1 Tax=Radiomyces spectabilis TaxID=64574 RepID=UPI002221055C|nr:uncharacterized protein BYT42DRAFT_614619 [Radiomyces spectabilis]KAI8377985.1 hypothetical protein BYT42DRAFT_614619 [Radiomyces spectabilis]
MSKVDAQYICQQAANAIIAEIGTYCVSSDALQAVNQFNDEFLAFLLSSASSFDLSRIKTAVLQLIPATLGKNAIIEAELEIKTFTETETVDYEAYERLRFLGTQGHPFPMKEALTLLRQKCIERCALADKRSKPFSKSTARFEISPIVVVYITAVIEHITEYMLKAMAVMAEHENTEYIRLKEVFLTLKDDPQLASTFHRSELRARLEKRAQTYGYQPQMLPSPAPSPVPSFHTQNPLRISTSTMRSDVSMEHAYDQYSEDGSDPTIRSSSALSHRDRSTFSMHSLKSNTSSQYRPMSTLSSSSSSSNTVGTSSSSKKGFRFFKKGKHQSCNLDISTHRTSTPVSSTASIYDPDAPAIDFDDLIRSGDTMRVSLTPNRLRSLETTDSLRLDDLNDRPVTRQSTTLATPAQTPTSPPPEWRRESQLDSAMRKLNGRPSDKPTISGHHTSPKRFNDPVLTPFENPRAAPKPPVSSATSISSVTSTSLSSSTSKEKVPGHDTLDVHSPYTDRLLRRSTGSRSIRVQLPDLTAATTSIATSLNHLDLHHQDLPNSGTTSSFARSSSVLSDDEDRKVRFSADSLKKYERPSSMVAKRASMIGGARPPSFHESYALNMENKDISHHRKSAAGPASLGDIGPQLSLSRLSDSHLISVPRRRQTSANGKELDKKPRSNVDAGTVLDKILKFERGTLDMQTLSPHDQVALKAQHERIMLLLGETDRQTFLSKLARNSTVDAAVQTDPSHSHPLPTLVVPSLPHRRESDVSTVASQAITEHGIVDGDEEWFLQDEDWEDHADQEIAVVNWLIGHS